MKISKDNMPNGRLEENQKQIEAITSYSYLGTWEQLSGLRMQTGSKPEADTNYYIVLLLGNMGTTIWDFACKTCKSHRSRMYRLGRNLINEMADLVT